jgi:hypothetical protein
MNNHITNVSVFGISVRGVSPGVVGNDNIIAGRGFQPIDTRGGAASPTITTTDLSGWQHRSSLSMIESLRYHPLLVTWLAVAVFVVVSSVLIRFRRRPARPYHYTVPWRPTAPLTNGHAHPTEPAASIAATVLVATNSSKPRRRRKQAPQRAALVDAKSQEVSA